MSCDGFNLRISFDGPLHVIADPPPPTQTGKVIVTATCNGITITGEAPMSYTLSVDDHVPLTIAYKDRNGNDAQVDGDVTWESSDDTIATVTVDGSDSFSADLQPGATLGNAQIKATADADLGEGIKEIVTMFLVTIVAGSAVAGTITPGEAEPIAPERKVPRR